MVFKSRWTIDIPRKTLPSFIFGSPTATLPDRSCFLDADHPERYVLTYDDYRLWSQRFATGLQDAGLSPGDKIMLFSGNTIFFPIVLMGTVMAGGVFTGANPSYNAREVAYQFQNAEAKWLLCAEGSLQTGLEALELSGLGKDRLFVFDSGYDTFDGRASERLGCKHWTTLLAEPARAREFQWMDGETMLDDTICLNYSSGTTGLSKGK